MNTLDERHWARVQAIARAAAHLLARDAAETPIEAINQVDGSMEPAWRADAEWLVEQIEDRIEEEDFPAASVGEGSA
jgi:hypothetical protein